MRFFVAEGAPQNDGVVLGGVGVVLALRAELLRVGWRVEDLVLAAAGAGDVFPDGVAPFVHFAGAFETFHRVGAGGAAAAADQGRWAGGFCFFDQRAAALRAAQVTAGEDFVNALADENYAVLNFSAEHRGISFLF